MHTVETPNEVVEEPTVKSSKLQKIKSNVVAAGIIGIPAAITVASTFYSFKIMKMNYETSKLQLEAARNNAEEE